MKIRPVRCGPFANQSEIDAFNKLKSGLVSLGGDGEWVLLTNVAFSVTHQLQSDEIDMVVVGPPGVRVIEVKHWANRHRPLAEAEADRVSMKARRVGTTLRRLVPSLPHVEGVVLLTQAASAITKFKCGSRIRGVRFCSLRQWRDVVDADGSLVLTHGQVRKLARSLVPAHAVASDDSLRRLAGYVNLELLDTRREGFHRVYRGTHSVTRDRAILHLYDMSAGPSGKAEVQARWYHDLLRRLQQRGWAPRILDSFQDVPTHAGEMNFFTVLDQDAPSLAERRTDPSWDIQARLVFARSAVRAVCELHQTLGPDGEPLVHGNLSPESIRVLHDDNAALRGLGDSGRFLLHQSTHVQGGDALPDATGAGQVRAPALAPSGPAADLAGLRTSLSPLFGDSAGDSQAANARALLHREARGETVKESIPHLEWLERSLGKLLDDPAGAAPVPPARFWTEGQEVSFRDQRYRVVARLGSGSAATAFKVVELHDATGEEVGTFVARVAHDQESGVRTRDSHQLVRGTVGSEPGLSTVFEVAGEWSADKITALMSWVDGAPLADFVGVLPLLARDHDTDSGELAVRWLRTTCEALDALHRNGLVHGDVSPHNLIVSGEDLVLTGYDCVTRIGEPVRALGTSSYRSPYRARGKPASPAHDVHALAASFFHILCDRKPFARQGDLGRELKLDWGEDERGLYPALADFLDRALSNESQSGFPSAGAALEALRLSIAQERSSEEAGAGKTEDVGPDDVPVTTPARAGESVGDREAVPHPGQSQPNEVPWLAQLLASYPGSQWGNSETRGLDSDFARNTYVETELEADLWEQITERRVGLVILCGNAGDGKTALLQHLAQELEMGLHQSSERIIDRVLKNGTRVRMNLDGSAAHEGRSAHELLDQFLEPFHDGGPGPDGVVHLLAVNDGRLLEWIHSEPRETPLKGILLRLLDGSEGRQQQPCIRFHHLNRRSRVGKVSPADRCITTDFLERLLRGLYGGENAERTWEPCKTCTARERCKVYETARVFGPSSLPDTESDEVRARARDRLFEALQAVHLRGETHLTVRELRSALSYILFGTRYCEDYHGDSSGEEEPSYWDRAFDPESPGRQGEVLRELVQMDPALEAHPKIDRRLMREALGPSGVGNAQKLVSLRRRAYFEWTDKRICETARGEDPKKCLGLARGRNLDRFRKLPLLDDDDRNRLCHELCRGIARIGDLPAMALDRADVVPLRITPRTPTETAFWTDKPIDRFRLEAECLGVRATSGESVETGPEHELHRAALLIYQYDDGREEKLAMGAELFHRLLRLGSGYQLGDISTDDTFARLSIFLQRLVQENDRELMAWNPIRDEAVHRLSIRMSDNQRQELVIQRVGSEGGAS